MRRIFTSRERCLNLLHRRIFTPVRSACRTSRKLTRKKLCRSRRRWRSLRRRNSPQPLKCMRTRMAHASLRPPSRLLRDRTSLGRLPAIASRRNPDRAADLFAEARNRATAHRVQPLPVQLLPVARPAHAGPGTDRKAPHRLAMATEMEITQPPRPEQTVTVMVRMSPTEPGRPLGHDLRMGPDPQMGPGL